MTVHLSSIRRRAMLTDLETALNGGTIEWRTGAQEATPEAVATGTLLCTFTLVWTTTATGADGAAQTLTCTSINSPQNAVNTGTAGHFRLLTSGAVCAMIGDIGTGGSDLNLSSVAVVSGTAQTMTALTVPFGY